MEHTDYLAIRQHLRPAFQDVLDFGYLTGWRRGEVFTLEWRDVDRNAGVIRLRPEMCKTREGRVLVLSEPRLGPRLQSRQVTREALSRSPAYCGQEHGPRWHPRAGRH